jgi:hypothetical protein
LGKARTVAARLDHLPPKSRRVFGALRGAVHVIPVFFDPLPMAELDAWTQQAKKAPAPSMRRMLEMSLKVFWVVADDWRLTPAEQCALLSVSPRTLARWKTQTPARRSGLLDRLIMILLTYVRLVDRFADLAARHDEMLSWAVRFAGSACNPEAPDQSILGAFSERSVLAMLTHYRRVMAHLATTQLATDAMRKNIT